jgi:hypothetical protein
MDCGTASDSAIPYRVSKPKIFDEAMHVRLPKDTKARIDALRGAMRQGDYVRILLLDAIRKAEEDRAAAKRGDKPD